MTNAYIITMDSFGDTCPANWEEIADYLNEIISGYVAEATNTDENGVEYITRDDELALDERVAALWESYCSGDLPDAPKPSAKLWEA